MKEGKFLEELRKTYDGYSDKLGFCEKMINDMKTEFPFNDGIEGRWNIMRMRGYYSAAINPYVAGALRDWFIKWFGEMETRSTEL